MKILEKTVMKTKKAAAAKTHQVRKLTPEQEHIICDKGTELPFTGKFLKHKEDGNYVCARCGNKLFDSKTKFDSGTGWPSFFDSLGSVKLKEEPDGRIEVSCAECGAHLGHVFGDGPRPTGKRYCINSLALDFEKR